MKKDNLMNTAQANPQGVTPGATSTLPTSEPDLQLQTRLLNSIGQAVIATDPLGAITYWNRAAEQLYGWESAEVLGRSILDITPAEPSAEQAQAIMSSLRVGQAWSGEFLVRHRSGRSFPALVTDTPILDDDGRLIGIIGVSTDNTERSRLQSQLRASEQFAAATLDALSAHIAVLDHTGQIVAVNRSWRDFADANPPAPPGAFSESRLSYGIGVNYLALCEQATGPEQATAQTMAQGIRAAQAGAMAEFDMEYPCHSPTQQRWFHARVTRFAAGDYFVVAHENVTECRRAERESHLLLALTRVIAEADSFDAALTLALSLICETAGWNFTDADLWPPDEATRIIAIKQAVLHTGAAAHDQVKFKTFGGQTMFCDLTVEPLRDEHEEIAGLTCAAVDITALKQNEEALRQRLAELETLHIVSAALRTAQTRDEALTCLLDETLAALKTEHGAIWLYHADSDELRHAVDRGWFQNIEEMSIKPGDGIAGAVFASGQAHVSPDFSRDPLACPPVGTQLPAGWGGVCLPLLGGGADTKPAGVIYVSVATGAEALALFDAALSAHETQIDLVLSDLVMPEMGGLELLRRPRARAQGAHHDRSCTGGWPRTGGQSSRRPATGQHSRAIFCKNGEQPRRRNGHLAQTLCHRRPGRQAAHPPGQVTE